MQAALERLEALGKKLYNIEKGGQASLQAIKAELKSIQEVMVSVRTRRHESRAHIPRDRPQHRPDAAALAGGVDPEDVRKELDSSAQAHGDVQATV